jgi:hypothetical protein
VVLIILSINVISIGVNSGYVLGAVFFYQPVNFPETCHKSQNQ